MISARFRKNVAVVSMSALCVWGLSGCSTPRSDATVACRDKAQKTVKLKVVLDESLRPVGVQHDNGNDANVVNVCPGDYVRWKANKTGFEIEFAGEAPFDWTDRRKRGTFVGKEKPDNGNNPRDQWQVIDVVREDATKGVELKYAVVTRAGRLDPMIIIDN